MAQKNSLWILVPTILGSSMAFIDSSVVNVPLLRLLGDLGASTANVQCAFESYALFLVTPILVGPPRGAGLFSSIGRWRLSCLSSYFCMCPRAAPRRSPGIIWTGGGRY